LADSYIASAARQAGSVAELAASKKMDKYTSLAADDHFQPIAVEMLGPINESASHYSARNARIASAVLATAIPSVRLSVRLSVTRRHCVKTTAHSTTQFAPLNSKICLVL